MDNKELIRQISKIFHFVIMEWPEKLIIESSQGCSRNFDSLRDAWDKVENIVGISDPWKELMVWTIYKLLHAEARKILNTNNATMEIIPKDLNIKDVVSDYIESLDSEEWSFLLKR